ncbi:Protein FAR1-RELATED SEQUENCE 5 [Dendrobium catenatum]|uniref:Protein FAR1-RELATED SEQUENCE 5 n=1 Tax=Dendrobium catenatum TaxID=906689 RepID=A0A2I0XA88_9ASPA|nr:Protein FAR1-RELATED SEQUENCE 5 [Dendrobium catenatum]
MIRFTVDEAGYWKVKKFIENHYHDLPRLEDRHLLRSCRNMCDEKAFVLKAMTDAGIRTIDAFSFIADEVGGVENIRFTRRDAYNFSGQGHPGNLLTSIWKTSKEGHFISCERCNMTLYNKTLLLNIPHCQQLVD